MFIISPFMKLSHGMLCITMNNMPPGLREELADDPEYQICMRNELLHDHECERDSVGHRRSVEWEHCWVYAANQIQERWAIISICWFVHRGPGLVKQINEWISINRMTPEDEAKYPRYNWIQRRKYLNSLYGDHNPQGQPTLY